MRVMSEKTTCGRHCGIGLLFCATALLWTALCSAFATACELKPQGDGRVGAIIDGRTFRLQDGREIRLAGIEAVDTAGLGALVAGRDVTLRGDDDTPDRYGRQPAFVFLDQSATSVQTTLLEQGMALFSAAIADQGCAAELTAAEAKARLARRGIWSDSSVIKNAESPGDILTRVGRFAVVEGKVLSVRTAGATVYVNFGRRWTRDFAVTISRRMVTAFEAAGISPNSLENKRIRVRGWVEKRNGPRIEALHVGQIEVVSGT